jgi:hypothetical protein
VLWPYIASQVGLVLLWGALVGVVTQFFLNMEVERYTLATGETALTGFNRFWRHWGLVFAVLAYLANLWPGWALSSATLVTYLFGGSPTVIAVGQPARHRRVADLRARGLRRPRAADLRQGGRRARAGGARHVTLRDGRGFVVGALGGGLASVGTFPEGLGITLIFGAIAFAGSGGAQNLCQSNWIRDKGFGMGQLRAASGQPHHRGGRGDRDAATSYIFEPTAENMRGGAAGGASPTSSRLSASCS